MKYEITNNPMTVEDLYHSMVVLLRDGKGDCPICVAFRWKGDTVLSDITTCDVNGETIQLGEESFVRHAEEWYLDNHHINSIAWGAAPSLDRGEEE